jgi:CelD/BcsL family acetyltransferase involved in cellulose biosynthesis
MRRSGDSVTPSARYDVRVEPLPPLDLLETQWRALEQQSRGSFFQSWVWIGTWLRTLCPLRRARLLSVHGEGRVVGLGIVVSPRLRLQRTSSATPYVDLAGLRLGHQDYVTTVPGSRTRANLRRTARKLIDQFGPLACCTAVTLADRLEFFDELVRLHQAHWDEDSGEQGAFADPRIIAFHHALIAASTQETGVHLMRLEAGGTIVGYLYHLVWRGIAYFYQAGINYRQIGGTGSPGLLLLSTAINEFAGHGFDRYELMAGNAEYKRSLAMAEGRMAWLSVDRVGWRARIVDLYRRRHGQEVLP